jgi:undecaprenyl phosphate-alpha-L-ara4N flippase subunit ArnE
MRSTEVLLTLICVFMIGCGQILFKLAARDVTLDGFNTRSLLSWLSPPMLAALAIYAGATLLWVWVLRTASLSVVYPLYALAFVLVPLLAWALFGEPMAARHWVGAALIVGGVWLMTGGAS